MEDIKTLVVLVGNSENDETNQYLYECQSVEKWNEFVAWYERNLKKGQRAKMLGYTYNNPKPVMAKLIER
jgi:hypothetical protein